MQKSKKIQVHANLYFFVLGAFLLDFMGRYDRHNMSWLVIIFHKTFVNYLLYKKFYVIMKT